MKAVMAGFMAVAHPPLNSHEFMLIRSKCYLRVYPKARMPTPFGRVASAGIAGTTAWYPYARSHMDRHETFSCLSGIKKQPAFVT